MQEKENNLLPCPFCGGEADVNFNNGVLERQYYVHCCKDIIHGCVVQDTTYARETDAIKAWNTRTPSPEVIEQVKGKTITFGCGVEFVISGKASLSDQAMQDIITILSREFSPSEQALAALEGVK